MDTFTLVIFIVLLIITAGLVIAGIVCIVWMGVILFKMFSTADRIQREQRLIRSTTSKMRDINHEDY